MPIIRIKQSLIKIRKLQYRNPIYLAREWRKSLDNCEFASPSALAHYLRVSRARVTQILNILQLSPEVVEMISSLGDPLISPIIAEKRLRPLLALTAQQQKDQLEILLSKSKQS